MSSASRLDLASASLTSTSSRSFSSRSSLLLSLSRCSFSTFSIRSLCFWPTTSPSCSRSRSCVSSARVSPSCRCRWSQLSAISDMASQSPSQPLLQPLHLQLALLALHLGDLAAV